MCRCSKTVTFPLSIFQTAQFCVIVCTYKWQLRVWMYRIKQEYFSNVNKINMQDKTNKNTKTLDVVNKVII